MMLKSILLVLLVSCAVLVRGDEETTWSDDVTSQMAMSTPKPIFPKPLYSLNTEYTKEQLQNLPANVFILQALSYIFTGSFDGQTEIGDELDTITLAQILELGLGAYASAVEDDPPDNFEDIFKKLSNILERLNTTGTSSVFFKDIKEYLKIKYALYGAAIYWEQNKEAIRERFQKYLVFEFLGGLEDGNCKSHTLQWFQDISKAQLWAIQMLDSVGKLPAGLMNANIHWVGNYKECNEVYTDKVMDPSLPPIQGRYCRVAVGFPIQQLIGDLPIDDKIGLNVGTCFSNTCENKHVMSIMSNTLKLLGAFHYSWITSVKCDDTMTIKPSTASKTWIILLSIIVVFVILATLYDIAQRIFEMINKKPVVDQTIILDIKTSIAGSNVLDPKKQTSPAQKTSKLHEFIINCSIYSNAEKFVRTDNGGKISCLHGIRLFSMIWIIWGHTYNYLVDRSYFFLLDNIRNLQELNEQPYAQLIVNGMYGVDTFFLMSAFLLTIGFMNKIHKSKRLTGSEWAYYYIHRYWRLMPPFIIIMIIYIWIMPYVGSGPLWTAKDFPIRNKDCHDYWWTYLVFMNNFIPNGKGSTCMGYLWYIPNDYQFYAISPIFLILLYRNPKAGKALIGFCMAGCLFILAFLTANVYESRRKDIIQVLQDIWEDVYIKPYCRAAPWLVGIALGYIFFKLPKVKLNYFIVALGWITSGVLNLSAVFGGFTNHAKGGRRMETAEYALFFSLTRLTWSLSVAWVIFACHYGYGGVINRFLSSKAFLPLTRLSYCCYLVHPPLMVAYYFSQHAIFHANHISLIYLAIGHIVITFILAFFYMVFFELPFVAIEKLIYSPKK